MPCFFSSTEHPKGEMAESHSFQFLLRTDKEESFSNQCLDPYFSENHI
jgi:hypothetical protein